MGTIIAIAALLRVVVAMGLSIALELSGKLRIGRETYTAVQAI
jgi:hypothetical protein